MYRHCIYCSAELGANEALEAFPVGRTVAFDGEKGRLWAVCPKCARWNLAPLEERWEAVEAAERTFGGARLRVQSENVGLARLPDGARLIRVGQALPGELAAWRYGSRFARRRARWLLAAGALGTAAAVALGGAMALAGPVGAGFVYGQAMRLRYRRVIHRVPAGASPTGEALELRRWHTEWAALAPEPGGGGIALEIPGYRLKELKADWRFRARVPDEAVVLPDAQARAFLERALVHVNAAGASRRRVEDAVGRLAGAGSAEDFLRSAAEKRLSLGKRPDRPGFHLSPDGRLALEMALHEEQERRALEGELTLLEAAWREAEEIAAIADRLAAPALPGKASSGSG